MVPVARHSSNPRHGGERRGLLCHGNLCYFSVATALIIGGSDANFVCAFTIFTADGSTRRGGRDLYVPYMAKIQGQEDFVYVWTLGVAGIGDEQDKLVTVDVTPASDNYGKVGQPVGGRAQRGAPHRAQR